jgi:hypothetical protein
LAVSHLTWTVRRRLKSAQGHDGAFRLRQCCREMAVCRHKSVSSTKGRRETKTPFGIGGGPEPLADRGFSAAPPKRLGLREASPAIGLARPFRL